MANESSPAQDVAGAPPTITVGTPPSADAEKREPVVKPAPPPPAEARPRVGSEAQGRVAEGRLIAELDEGARSFKDPTRELSPAVESLLSFEAAIVEQWRTKLQQRPFLLLTSEVEPLLYSAAHALKAVVPGWAPRELMFGTHGQLGSSLPILDSFRRPDFGGERLDAEGFLIFAFAYQSGSDVFLNDLPLSNDVVARWVHALGGSRAVVALATPQCVHAARRPRLLEMSYAVHLDFVGPCVREHRADASADLLDEVRRQCRLRLWGSNDTESFARLSSALQNGSFDAECDARRARRSLVPGASTCSPNEPLELFKLTDDTPIEAAVLFVATHFKRLRVAEFTDLVSALLEGTAEPQPASAPGPSNAVAAAPVVPPRLLRDVWMQQRKRTMERCRVRTQIGQPPTVGFEDPLLREPMRQSFATDDYPFFDDLCRRMDRAGWIFHPSESVRDDAVGLTSKRIQDDPAGYGRHCIAALQASVVERATAAGASADPWAFAAWPEVERRTTLDGLSALLTRLIEDGASAAASALLTAFLDRHRHEELLLLLPRVEPIAFTAERLAAYRRLVDEGAADVRAAAARSLRRLLSGGGARSATAFAGLRAWDDGSVAPHREVALMLLRDLMTAALSARETPVVHPIVSALVASEPADASALIAWIAKQESGDHLQDLPGLKFGVILFLAYLWILPRPRPDEALEEGSPVWMELQGEWLGDFISTASTLAPPGDATPFHDTLAAMALVDCVATMQASDASLDADSRDALVNAIRRIAAALSSARRRGMHAQWRALDHALLHGLARLTGLIPHTERATRERVRRRWTDLRSAIGALLAPSMSSADGTAR